MIATASSALSTKLIRSRSERLIVPASAIASQLMMRCQNSVPKSRKGMRFMRPVWIRVRVSKSSSSVPKPPGKIAIALARIRKCILRIAK